MKRRTFISALCGGTIAAGFGWKQTKLVALDETSQNGAATEKGSDRAAANKTENADWRRFEFAEKKMGVPARIIMHAPDAETANAAANAA
ncbi:MAG: hypothetical protein IJZ10_04435, partial [Thermoguttaceae bacterium]|nr:hypothetical protein [Thermoguttaceae bacterium]